MCHPPQLQGQEDAVLRPRKVGDFQGAQGLRAGRHHVRDTGACPAQGVHPSEAHPAASQPNAKGEIKN